MFNKKQPALLPYNELIPAFYCRVSSDKQAEDNTVSLPDQVIATQSLARSLAMNVYDDYVLLEDESGSTLDRPQLHKLRQWIKEKKINAIIVRSLDRLSRNSRYGEEILDEMAYYGVRLFIAQWGREFDTHDNTPDRDWLKREMDNAKYWRTMLSKTMGWGKRGRIERQNPAMGGHVKYGFSKYKDEQKMWQYVFSDEAAIVQSIYNWLTVDRISVLEIQKRLKGKATPKEARISEDKMKNVKKRGYGEWSLSSIYSILRDETYTGVLTLYRDSKEYEPVSIQIPAIIDRATFDEAQKILNSGRRMSNRGSKSEFLLARLMTCSCGAAMHVDSIKKENGVIHNYYACGRAHSKRQYADPTCNAARKFWIRDNIDNNLWAWIIGISEKPELLKAYLEEAQEAVDEKNRPIYNRLAELDTNKKKHERRLLTMVELFSDIDTNDPRFKTERMLLERARDEYIQVANDIEEEKIDLESKIIHQTINTDFINDWCKYAYKVHKGMLKFDFNEKRSAIESLSITASPIVKDGKRILLVFIADHCTEAIPLDDTDSFQDSLNGWKERGFLVFVIPLD